MNYNMHPFCLILISSFATFLDKARAWDTLITFILLTYYCQVLNSVCVLCPTDIITLYSQHAFRFTAYLPFLLLSIPFCNYDLPSSAFFSPSALRISFKIFFSAENFLLVANASSYLSKKVFIYWIRNARLAGIFPSHTEDLAPLSFDFYCFIEMLSVQLPFLWRQLFSAFF